MFDIGWLELLLIAITALIVVGPKELPGLFRTVGQYMGKARGMAREFQRSMEQAADESGLQDAANSLKSLNRPDFGVARPSAKSFAKGMLADPADKATDAKKSDDAAGTDEPVPELPAEAGTESGPPKP